MVEGGAWCEPTLPAAAAICSRGICTPPPSTCRLLSSTWRGVRVSVMLSRTWRGGVARVLSMVRVARIATQQGCSVHAA